MMIYNLLKTPCDNMFDNSKMKISYNSPEPYGSIRLKALDVIIACINSKSLKVYQIIAQSHIFPLIIVKHVY